MILTIQTTKVNFTGNIIFFPIECTQSQFQRGLTFFIFFYSGRLNPRSDESEVKFLK